MEVNLGGGDELGGEVGVRDMGGMIVVELMDMKVGEKGEKV